MRGWGRAGARFSHLRGSFGGILFLDGGRFAPTLAPGAEPRSFMGCIFAGVDL